MEYFGLQGENVKILTLLDDHRYVYVRESEDGFGGLEVVFKGLETEACEVLFGVWEDELWQIEGLEVDGEWPVLIWSLGRPIVVRFGDGGKR